MSFWIRLVSGACVVWLAVALSGCTPSGRSQLSEEKEPHFVLGKSRVNAMDFQGAIEAFEQSLEANPHSAAAHFELGWLYDEKTSDPAAAIYHYQEYLKLNPQRRQCGGHQTAHLPLQTATGGGCVAAAEHARRAAAIGKTLRAKPAIAGRSRQMARVLRQSTGGGQNQFDPAAGLRTPQPAANPTPIQPAQNFPPRRPARTRAAPQIRSHRRRAAHAHGRRGRNGDGHHPQIRRET